MAARDWTMQEGRRPGSATHCSHRAMTCGCRSPVFRRDYKFLFNAMTIAWFRALAFSFRRGVLVVERAEVGSV